MGAPEIAIASGGIAALSDKELVQKYCTGLRNEGIFSELWSRHEQRVRGVVRKTVLSQGFCPPGWGRDAFADSAFSRVQLYVFRRLCSFLDFRSSFVTWLSILTRSAVLDEYGYLRKFREVPESAVSDSESDRRLDEPEDSCRSPTFRSEYLEPSWWFKPSPRQDASASAEQRKAMVMRLLLFHATQSDGSLDSAQTIRLRYWRDWTLAQLGMRLCGPPRSDRDKNRQEQAVRRLLLEDYQRLRAMLSENFGVTQFGDL